MYGICLFIIYFRHLGRNPFSCDCNLRWLSDYLHKNPIETSAARCESPKKLQKRRIDGLSNDKFKCKLLFLKTVKLQSQIFLKHSNVE
jgi:hypothetical protein